MRRSSEVYRRALERKKRHDEAHRLRDVAPHLERLELDIVERRPSLPGHEVQHRRIVVVDRAPAIFEFACSDRVCGATHEVSAAMLLPLGRGETEFEITHLCDGAARGAPCSYELCVTATAAYAELTAPPSGTALKSARSQATPR
ncbi:MAG: hypothetical protein EXR75_07160 [Myxococcales bacterium]|nr:hypothetical protein [Myxococcales bacterium]